MAGVDLVAVEIIVHRIPQKCRIFHFEYYNYATEYTFSTLLHWHIRTSKHLNMEGRFKLKKGKLKETVSKRLKWLLIDFLIIPP